MQNISPDDLIVMHSDAQANLRVDLAYARADNLLFGERIYKEDAQLWLHKDLADIVFKAAHLLKPQGYRLVLFDGLRTKEAQEKMLATQRVRDNPHWLQEPRLLSPPGAGAHPRAMAVDCTLETLDGGRLIDMGTAFDYLSADPSPQGNPAHRDHPDLSEEIRKNREILDRAMSEAAKLLGRKLVPLPQEWWDFRFDSDVYNKFAPLKDSDLKSTQRLVS